MSVHKFLDASTAYLTNEDVNLLSSDPDTCPMRVIHHKYGWWINIPEEKFLGEYVQQIYAAGYSENFASLFKKACMLDCWWIYLDWDGGFVDGIEMFEE